MRRAGAGSVVSRSACRQRLSVASGGSGFGRGDVGAEGRGLCGAARVVRDARPEAAGEEGYLRRWARPQASPPSRLRAAQSGLRLETSRLGLGRGLRVPAPAPHRALPARCGAERSGAMVPSGKKQPGRAGKAAKAAEEQPASAYAAEKDERELSGSEDEDDDEDRAAPAGARRPRQEGAGSRAAGGRPCAAARRARHGALLPPCPCRKGPGHGQAREEAVLGGAPGGHGVGASRAAGARLLLLGFGRAGVKRAVGMPGAPRQASRLLHAIYPQW